MISSFVRPVRGMVCISSAGRAGAVRKSQIGSFSPFRCTGFRGLGQSTNVTYGSGFLLADGPTYLEPHTLWDLQLGKTFGEKWNLGVTALNVLNKRFPFDVDNTFAGNHFNNPREIIASLRYKFHY
jgi:outer membrane receptor protein involved in Fe transport